MKNLIRPILAASIIAAMLTIPLAGCYLIYNAFPTWFQHGLGLVCFSILVISILINLWSKAKGFQKKYKLKRDYKRFETYKKQRPMVSICSIYSIRSCCILDIDIITVATCCIVIWNY